MPSRIFKIFLILSIALLAVFLQFSFISPLPVFFRAINLPLAFLLIILIFFSSLEALIVSFFFGFIFDSWYFSPFGTYLLSFLVIILFAQIVLNNWLTNRSLYSFLVLTIISSFFYNIVWSSFNFIFSLGGEGGRFFLFSWNFIKNLFFSAFWLVLICGLSFVVLSQISHRLRPVFLKR